MLEVNVCGRLSNKIIHTFSRIFVTVVLLV